MVVLEKLSGERPALDRQGAGSNPASRHVTDESNKPRIGTGYPIAQLLRALASGGAQAATRAGEWLRVLTGLQDGSLQIGSRTPVESTPAWVTLGVIHGGFATGEFSAGGPLLPHEMDKVRALPPSDRGERAALNEYYLGEEGRGELGEMLQTGRFRVRVPEEAALLVFAWLMQHGEPERAAQLVATLGAFLGRLRFYPVPHALPLPVGTGVHLAPAADSVQRLRAIPSRTPILKMNEALLVWTPLYDRAVALWLETVEGQVPSLRRTPDGSLERAANGQPIVQGGWPCRAMPGGWAERTRGLLEDYAEARRSHTRCGKPEDAKGNFARLRVFLRRQIDDPGSLGERDVGQLRRILASYVAAHGAPGSAERARTRAAQEIQAHAPLHRDYAQALADRLATFEPDEGVAELHPLLAAVPLASGAAPAPASVAEKALRCLQAPPEHLVERGVIRSAESLASVTAQLTAQTRGEQIADPALRRVYEGTYLAFRRRRSLLLLDLEKQVRLEELPWISAVQHRVGSSEKARTAARTTLARLATLAISEFPQTLMPNKLVTELRALSTGAGLSLPLVNELAADIFMGAFSETFLRAAHAAARMLRGTLYERYYAIPYDAVLRLDDVDASPKAASSPGLARLCEELAGPATRAGRSVARNGTIIEQAQIVTTHNLAVLFGMEEVRVALRPKLPDLARRCFEWTCRALQSPGARPLRKAKNAAYSWRQMVFYLSLCTDAELRSFLTASAETLGHAPEGFRARFAPAIAGLQAAVSGESPTISGDRRRLLGWSLGPHWVLPKRE